MKSIALIGMMGSGKTTIAKILSEKLGINYFCSDVYIEEKEKRTISQIFESDGEEYFRKIERKAIQEISRERNIILATGGGIVLDKKNIDDLKDNRFIIIFLNRDIDEIIKDISTDNRPLIKEDVNKLYKIYKEREFLYKKYCDIIVRNSQDINITVDKILEDLKYYSCIERSKNEKEKILN